MSFIIKYRRFINLSFTYENQEIENIISFPTKDCQKLLNRFNLIFRRTPSGLSLYYGEIPDIKINERLCFRFGFLFPSGEFTKGIGDNTHSALYFNNLSGDDVSEAGNAMMKSGDKVSPDDFCNIKTQSFNKIYFSPEISPSQTKTYFLSRASDSTVNQQIEVYMPENKDFITIPINSPEAGNYFPNPGLYSLKNGGSAERIYLDNELGKIKTDGVIELFWEDEQKAILDEIQYKINFKT